MNLHFPGIDHIWTNETGAVVYVERLFLHDAQEREKRLAEVALFQNVWPGERVWIVWSETSTGPQVVKQS